MQAGPDAYEIIRRYEGLRLQSYQDPKGIWTIGWGHTGDDVEPLMTIDQNEALRHLADDVHFVETGIMRSIIREPILQHHFDALVSLAFNIGIDKISKSNLLKYYNLGDDTNCSNDFLKWNKCKIHGKLVAFRGLTNRRQTERTLYILRKLIF